MYCDAVEIAVRDKNTYCEMKPDRKVVPTPTIATVELRGTFCTRFHAAAKLSRVILTFLPELFSPTQNRMGKYVEELFHKSCATRSLSGIYIDKI